MSFTSLQMMIYSHFEIISMTIIFRFAIKVTNQSYFNWIKQVHLSIYLTQQQYDDKHDRYLFNMKDNCNSYFSLLVLSHVISHHMIVASKLLKLAQEHSYTILWNWLFIHRSQRTSHVTVLTLIRRITLNLGQRY